MKKDIVSSSFRDPSGFLFHQNGVLYRQINQGYKRDFDHLLDSGLYKTLVDDQLLIPHKETELEKNSSDKAYKIIRPEIAPFISYPYEWSFSQLKDAALTTLKIQKKAFEFGMVLKDSSAYNIQFKSGKPILIDTLSFEKYSAGKPWVAYKQFCQHFLAPLALMSYTDIRLNQLFRIYLDGVPLDLASSLLPGKARLSLSLFTHIFLHSKSQQYYSDKKAVKKNRGIGRIAFKGLIDSLETSVKNLKWRPQGTEWGDYYQMTNYTSKAFLQKKQIIKKIITRIKPKTVWDLGANDGEFSRLASNLGVFTVAFDIDSVAVEKNYLKAKSKKEGNILPLIIDLTNPSGGIGWENLERASLIERGPVDMAFALALIHHLAISNNLPFEKIAHFFSLVCKNLIIEFVPKSDSQVQKLLSTREDIFKDYSKEEFEKEFKRYFKISQVIKVSGSKRILYLMKK